MIKRLLSNDFLRSRVLVVLLILILLALAFAPFVVPGVKALSVAATPKPLMGFAGSSR